MRKLSVIALFALALLALFAALTTLRRPEAQHAASVAHEAAAPVPKPLRVFAARAPGAAKPASVTPDGHPHPITEEHKRLYREADLIDGAAARLRKSDVAGARAKLAAYRAEYAPGEGDDGVGLSLLADCIERRDAASLASAQAFYDRYTHSMVRRQIRKQCLEAGGGAR